jgi:hypothetical protein
MPKLRYADRLTAKMLARGLRIAQRSLQRIAVKQGTATRRHGKVTHINLPVNFERLVHLIGEAQQCTLSRMDSATNIKNAMRDGDV